MDGYDFDDLGRALGGESSRRRVVRLLVGAALGALIGAPASDAPAKPKKGCPRKPCPKGLIRDKGTCKCECKRTPCRGGKEFDTKSCRCKCSRDLRECKDGCVGKDECCPGDPPCPEDPKGCCDDPGLDVCTIDGCCRETDGFKACNNFCVDTTTSDAHCGRCNAPCGPAERCVAGECEPVRECPNGGTLCEHPSGPFCAPKGFSCCGDTFCNDASRVCCDPTRGVCCDKGECAQADKICCTGGREVCDGHCCEDFRDVCCGDQCCADFDCLNGACCANGVCGQEVASQRICPTDEETCCTNNDGGGYACPEDGRCATDNNCCPAGTFYEQACDKCCADVRDRCSECVPMFAGRTR